MVVPVLLLLAGCVSPSAAASGDADVLTRADAPGPGPAVPGDTAVVARDDRPGSAATSRAGTASSAVRRYRSVRSHKTVPQPVRVTVPSIGVSSRLQRLGRRADGTIDVPDRWQQAGWYRGGPKPGQVGPAVVLGHVDSKSGPAVFFRLRELRPGDEVGIHRADGSALTFVVERTERHAKTRFPSHEVYLPTLRPTLRLVTCGGAFDSASGHYRDNVVVFATLAE